ncbi:MAG: hypothetical protein IJZ87_06625 [Bacteroidales bacterium]|nr:hypothetical protein [Bacteroidales bacterium]
MVHYIVIGIIVLLIIGVQIYFFSKTYKEINSFSNIFPNSTNCLYAQDSEIFLKGKKIVVGNETDDIDDELFDGFSHGRSHDSIFERIISSLNTYLRKNKGAASDYHLMKDIVERNCDAKENEIDTQIPTPLYTGLMGTVLGIIVGVAFLVFSGGLSSLLDSNYDLINSTTDVSDIVGRKSAQEVKSDHIIIIEEGGVIDELKANKLIDYVKSENTELKLKSDDSGSEGVSALLSGIALAMIASFVGILLTTIASYIFKNAKRNEEEGKDKFLSWIQSELLPQLSSDVSGTLVKMGQNLRDFNTTFSENTKELSATLDKVNESYRGQAEVLQSIKELRINEIATANITIYDKLKDSTQELGDVTQHISEYSEQLSKLGKYLKNSEKYLTQVKELNEKLDEGEERMKTIERLGQFFEAELQQIQNRKSEMTKAVGVVDDALQEALIKMQENVGKQFVELEKSSAIQQNILQEKLKETTALIEELKNLTAVKASLEKMEKTAEKSSNEQNRRLDTLISSINFLASEIKERNSIRVGFSNNGTPIVQKSLPKWTKVLLIVGGSLVCLTCLLVIAFLVLKVLKSYNLI